MALNQTLDRSASTVVVSGDTGARANGRDEVTITVTAKDTSAAVIPYAEVFIEETSGRHFISDAEMPQPPVSEGRLRGPDPIVTDANGAATVKVKSFYEGTLTFDVFVGAPQGGTGGAAGAGVFNGNNVDSRGVYTQKTLAADVGATGGYTTTYSSDQVIDAAWLTANNGGSTAIQDTRFQNCMVTVTTEVQFTNCLFEGSSNQYALLVNLPSVALSGDVPANYLLQDCTLTGGTEAALSGYRIHMIDCLVEECGKHGIQLTKRSGTGTEPVQVVRSVVRKVGSGGSTSAPQGYGVHVVDSGHVTFRGLSVECPYHTTGGAIAGYYPVGAVYVGADEEPITDFFFYTSWIDGGVLLDDAGLGIGPEGQMFSPNFFGRNYNPAVPLFDTTDVQSLWTKGQMWMDTGALVSNEEAGGDIRTFTGKKYNNLWASGAALDTQATFTLDTAYALVTLDAFDQFGPFNQNLLDQPPLNTSFGDWTPATINSSPVPTVLAETPLPFPQTGTADRISFNNSAAFADGALVRSRQVDVDAGFTAPYEVEVAAANGDGFKTVLSLKDSSDDLVEQTTVAFSNVFAEEHISQAATTSGAPGEFVDFDVWSGNMTVVASAETDPDGGTNAWSATGNNIQAGFYSTASASVPGIDGWTTGQTWTISFYLDTSAVTSGTYFYRVDLRTGGGVVIESINASLSLATPGVIGGITAGTTGGPGYTVANAIRVTPVVGTSWYKYETRLTDYSGTAERMLITPANYGASGTYLLYKPEIRKGDHVSSQQLLTVDDGVENLLRTVSVEDFSDFTTNGTVSTSSIAAPDGTLTAQDIAYTVTGATYIQKTAADYGSVWKLGAGWSSSFYFYQPTLPGNVQFDTYIYNSGGTQINNFRTTINSSGALIAFGGTAVYGPAFTAERNLDLRKIGDTGWYQVTVFIGDYGVAADEFLFIRLVNQTAGGTYTYWNPTLRYGDWVARGKNWQGTPLIDWAVTAGASKAYSPTPAPDGTLSAVEASLPAGGNCDLSATNALAAAIPAYSSVTLEAYINHSDRDWNSGRIYHYLRSSSSFPEMVYIDIDPAGGFASSLVTLATGGPGYTTAEHTEATQIGTDGWWRYRLTITDYGGTALTTWNYLRAANSAGATRGVFWGPRITVGNPADARGYFVSGPQNLLGDGSDYTSGYWTKDASVTISANAQVAPNGRLEADDITRAVDADDFRVYPATIGSAITGGAVHYSFYVKPPSGLSSPSELISFVLADDPFTAFQEEVDVRLDYSVPAAPTVLSLSSITTGGPGYTVDDVTITPISNGWSRIQIDLFDYGNNAERVYIRHYGRSAANGGSAYTVSYWGSEVTTLDRTPTANDLRPVSGGIVDFDAYPPEHRSLFASYTDLGDNNYRVTTTLTDDGSTTDYVQIEHFQANSADTTHQIYLSNPTLEDPDLELEALLINPPLPTAAWFEIPLITHATHELGNDGRVPTMVNSTNYYASHLGWGSDEGAAEDEPSPYGGDKITVIVPPVRGTGFP